MVNTGDVRLDLAAIERDLEDEGYDSCHVQFVPDQPGGSRRGGDSEPLILAVKSAVAAANGEGADQAMWGQMPVLTLDGVGLTLKSYWGPDSLTSWLSLFCASLREQGHAGLVGATPVTSPPPWLLRGQGARASAYVALDQALTEPSAAQLWCERATAWSARGGGDAYLSATPILQHDPSPDVAVHVGAALRAGGQATLIHLDADAERATRIHAQEDGLAVYQALDPAREWSSLVANVREALIGEADRIRVGFIAMTPVWAYGWDYRGRDLPALPTVPAYALRRNTAVWSRHVPDAHGIQLLTGAHIEQARDLSAWRITGLGHDRFLVEASDPSAWFASGSPSLAVVEQARAEFGNLIVPATGLD